jgi:hypothetical protein
MKPSEDTKRLEAAVEDASIAFWCAFADLYPEATHGDFPPDATIEIDTAMHKAAKLWLEFNADPVEDEDEEEGWTEYEHKILLHRIEFIYFGSEYLNLPLGDSEVEHIAYCISQGISEGELTTELEYIIPTATARGYWRINNG